MFWSWMRHGLAAGVISGVGCWASAADALSLRLIGSYEIPTGTMFEGAEFGGISAIDLGPDGVFYALSDDRGGEGRTPRFYMIDLDYDGGGFHDVKIAGVRHMRDLGGEHFPSDRRSVDPEGLRVAPNGNLYWSSEGNFSDAADEFVQPFLREMTPEGEYVRDLAVPGLFNYFDNATAGADPTRCSRRWRLRRAAQSGLSTRMQSSRTVRLRASKRAALSDSPGSMQRRGGRMGNLSMRFRRYHSMQRRARPLRRTMALRSFWRCRWRDACA